MKYIYFGTPEFAATVLRKLTEAGFTPIAVVTNPDRPVGRKKIITSPPVKNIALGKVLQPEVLDEGFAQELKSLKPDFGILAAYGKIVPKAVIDVFPKGIIVVHPSLLPKYRGATPIQSAILAGKKETGTTLILMDEKVDHGPIITSSNLSMSDVDNFESLSKKLAELSGSLLIKTLPDYLSGKIKPQEQDHAQATYTKKFTTEDGFVDLKKDPPDLIWLKVRALNPEPGVFTLNLSRGGPSPKRMKILEADLVEGRLVLKKVQMEGEKPKVNFLIFCQQNPS